MNIRAMLCREISDDIHTLRLESRDLPDPASGEIQVRIKACSVNFSDILTIQGKYQNKPPLPFSPGGEISGDVTKVGKGVPDIKEGDMVMAGTGFGGFSEGINVSATRVRSIPGKVSYAKAASYSAAYATAWAGLKTRGGLRKGETLLVHGATGGVGLAAVEMGKYFGAKVIATGGRDDKLAVVKSRGADYVINYTLSDGRQGGFREKVKELTDGKGADVIYDTVGGDVFDESLRCINWGGRLLAIGFTSGRWPMAPVNIILIKQIAIIGVRAEVSKQDREVLYQMLGNGQIDPYICASFPLEKSLEAMQMLVDRNVVGKVIVTANGYNMDKK